MKRRSFGLTFVCQKDKWRQAGAAGLPALMSVALLRPSFSSAMQS